VCRVNITYVSDLPIEGDAVKFFLPTFIAPRYTSWRAGADPVGGSGTLRIRDGLAIAVACTTASAITALASSTHAITVQHQPGQAVAIVTLTGPVTHLDKDFELLITTAAPHQPRVIVETHATHGPAAVLTLAPQFDIGQSPCELIFLIDRSGSMAGSKMEQAARAMQLFLRSLPTTCYFNILGVSARFTSFLLLREGVVGVGGGAAAARVHAHFRGCAQASGRASCSCSPARSSMRRAAWLRPRRTSAPCAPTWAAPS